MRHARQRARRGQPFESVDQFVTFLPPADDDRRQLPVTFQRPRHGPFRFRQVQAIAAIVFADIAAFQFPHVLVGPAQHRLNVRAPAGVNQYVKLISERGGISGLPRPGPPSRKTAAPGVLRRQGCAAVFLEGGPRARQP